MAPFSEAKTFKDLCELNAQFVEEPNNLDPESKPLIHYLAALNRAGFLTTSSQPGEDHGHSKQRAFVGGLASSEVALRIERLSLCSDLYIMTVEPGHYKGCMMPVTIDLFRPHTWFGEAGLDDETGIFLDVLELQEHDCVKDRVIRELNDAWEVQVIDLCWGRTDYLWNTLANELCVMLNPHEGWRAGEHWPYPELK